MSQSKVNLLKGLFHFHFLNQKKKGKVESQSNNELEQRFSRLSAPLPHLQIMSFFSDIHLLLPYIAR